MNESFLSKITDTKELIDLMSSLPQGNSRLIDAEEMAAALKQRVRGQDAVINYVSQFIRRQWAKEKRSRPIASLMFVGPPATGKTELAKAMAEYLFGSEKNMLQFNCGELDKAEGKTRLMGIGPMYQGSDKGGELTRPMMSNPRRLILFDEVEKAHPSVHDIFLSMMDQGFVTAQESGKAVDFTQAIIVLTSNAIQEQLAKLLPQFDDAEELSNAVKLELREAKVFRPEIISRFDRIFVYQKLPQEVVVEIIALKAKAVCDEYGLKLIYIAPKLIIDALITTMKAEDMRELRRIVDQLLCDELMEAKARGLKTIRLETNDRGQVVSKPAQ